MSILKKAIKKATKVAVKQIRKAAASGTRKIRKAATKGARATGKGAPAKHRSRTVVGVTEAAKAAKKAGLPVLPVKVKRTAKKRFGRTAASSWSAPPRTRASSRTRLPVGYRRRKAKRTPGK